MSNSYQRTEVVNHVSNTDHDTSITNLDDLNSSYNLNNNLLSNFNIISTKWYKIKYYVFAAITAIILIWLISDITSSSTSTPSIIPSSSDDAVQSKSDICESKDYFKQTLKEQYTATFQIIKNAENANKYEASGVIYDSSRDVFWVVFDSLYALGKITSDLMRSSDNILVHPLNNVNSDYFNGQDSGFEGITRDAATDILYILTESVLFKNNKNKIVYHPIIRSAKYDEMSAYTVNAICAIDFIAPSDNKGFEGLNLIHIDGQKYFVGLCEGNHCESGSKGKESGNGRVVLIDFVPEMLSNNGGEYQYLIDVGIDCLYKTIKQFKLPSYIDFIDYSALQFRAHDMGQDNLYDLAIVSQESSSLWIGQVEWSVDDGPDFDVNDDNGKIYQFPKRNDCETVFCNVEGVTFINNSQFVMVSDEAKKDGKQPWICGEKDQSIHIFKIV